MSFRPSSVSLSDECPGLLQAQALVEQENFQGALACLQASGESGQTPSGLVLQAVCLLHLDRPTEALQVCDRALSLAVNHPQAWLFRGVALHRLGRYRDAYASYEAATAQHQAKQASGFERFNPWVKVKQGLGKWLGKRWDKNRSFRHWVN